MAVEPLSEQLKEQGSAVLHLLDEAGITPQGLLWLHFHHLGDWRLTVISDFVDTLGRRKTYQLVEKALDKLGGVEGLTMFDVHLSSPEEIVPRVLGGAFQFPGGGIAEIVEGNFNGFLVDAIVYRMMPGRSTAEARAASRKAVKLIERLPERA